MRVIRHVIDHRGYVRVYGLGDDWVYEHRLVAERMVGRPLTSDEAVHHRNHVKHDNRPANLEILSVSEHVAMHNREQPKRKKGVPPKPRKQPNRLEALRRYWQRKSTSLSTSPISGADHPNESTALAAE